ncbi:LysR substrate-binding domain-containing protein [Turicimonas muris]|uniref:LysR substrate-binding domain-containing protein n=1 Tax=Turicimonas muris TaxID=1796652 RepID=UPI0024954384|nr:LysR family transcriptional regulator [Turicimonas muris]
MIATKNIAAWEVLDSLSSGQGLKQASIETDLDLARCTRLVQQLEEKTGLVLINHKERPAKLSKAGTVILPVVKELLSSYKKLEEAVEAARNEKIDLKVSIPINSPRNTIYPLIKACAKEYPEINLEIMADCDHEDVLRKKVKAAYLPYRPPSEGLIIFTVNPSFINVPLASLEYVRKNGMPTHPRDLLEHDIIIRSGRHYPLTKTLQKGSLEHPLVFRKIAFAGDVLSAKEALLAGDGISIDLSYSSCQEEVSQGLFVPVLGGWHKEPWDITIAVDRDLIHNSRVIEFFRVFAEAEGKASQVRARTISDVLKMHERECFGSNSESVEFAGE